MKNSILALLSLSVLIPLTACGSQGVKKSNVEQTQGQATTELTDRVLSGTHKHVAQVFDGEWVIKSVGNTKIDREENYPYINFVLSDHNFYASNGCNVLNGSFEVDVQKHTVTFRNVISTMRYCADVPWDSEINAALAEGVPVRYEYEMVDGQAYLYLLDGAGNRVMTMAKPGLDFLNGNWRVKSIGDEQFDDSEMSIFFDVEERTVHGNTGCNSFNGTIYVDPQNKQSFSLQNMAVTMRMCPNIEQQSKFLVALEQTMGAKANSDGSVNLINADGKTVMVLVKK